MTKGSWDLINIWGISYICIEKFNIVKISILPHVIYSQCNPFQNPSKLFCGYQQTHSKMYLERQKAQPKHYWGKAVRTLTLRSSRCTMIQHGTDERMDK